MNELVRDSTSHPVSRPQWPPSAPRRHREPHDHVFRRTFLARLPRASQIEAFEKVGATLAEILSEARWWGIEDGAALTARELEAASEDAGLLAEYVAHLAAQRFDNSLGREETRLCEKAESLAARLQDLAEELHLSAVSHLHSDEPKQ